jgi:hypothetical protein
MKTKLLSLLFFVTLSFSAAALEYKTYDFQKLSQTLGYPDRSYFGSTESEIIDLDTYTSTEDTYYIEINGYLRNFPIKYSWNGIGPETAKGIVGSINKIIERVPVIPNDLILFRGIDLKFRNQESYKIGEEIIEKGFLSTSTTFDIAYEFTKDNGSKNPVRTKKAILVLYQENDSQEKGILIDEQSEDEVLFSNGKLLKFMSVKNLNPYFESYLVQICKVTCAKEMNFDIQKYWTNYKIN